MNQQLSVNELKEIVQEKCEGMISLFVELHQVTGIAAGDISPYQSEQLNDLTASLVDSFTAFAVEKLRRNQLDDQ